MEKWLLGVNVALENLWNLSNLAYVLEQVDSLRIGFCYDSGHHYRHYPGDDLLSMYGSRLMALHLHDNNGVYAQHGLPFDGTIDWSTTMNKIAETDYSGPIAIEGGDGLAPCAPIRSPTVPVALTMVAELIRVCDGAYFNQLLRGRKICHADETACRPVLSHVFLELTDDRLGMFFSVCQIDFHISEVRPRYIKSRQHAIKIFQCLPGLCLDIAFANKSALRVVRKLSRNVDSSVYGVTLGDAVIPKIVIVAFDVSHFFLSFT
ncbi:Xylose isomerase-like TIM barrel [compost metagenome]